MKNLERKDILNVKKNNKKQSVFDNSEVVFYMIQVLSIKIIKAILVDSFLNT